MAEVQRAGRVGRDELDQHPVGPRGLAAEAVPLANDLGDDRLLGGRRQPQVDEAGAGDLERVDPALHGRLALQRVDQRRGEFARILLQRLGERHRGGAGQVAVRGLLGRFEHRRERRIGCDLGDGRAQRVDELLFGLDHGSILRGTPGAACSPSRGSNCAGIVAVCRPLRPGVQRRAVRRCGLRMPAMPSAPMLWPDPNLPGAAALPRHIGKYRVLKPARRRRDRRGLPVP